MLKKTLCLFLLLAFSAGCSPGVLALKRLGSSQKEMQRYVNRQEKGFLRLKQDIESGRLQKGISKESVVKKYGDPVFCDVAESGTPTHPVASGASAESAGNPEITQSCLYRSPTEYFSTDKAYLYFNQQELLISWKHEPAE